MKTEKKLNILHRAVAANFSIQSQTRELKLLKAGTPEIRPDAPMALFCGIAATEHNASIPKVARFLEIGSSDVEKYLTTYNELFLYPGFQRKIGLVLNSIKINEREEELV